jgi:hypothetical protein
VTRLIAHLFRSAVRIYLHESGLLAAVDKVELIRRGELELALIRYRKDRPGVRARHETCVDVTTFGQPPGSQVICGIDCPQDAAS